MRTSNILVVLVDYATGLKRAADRCHPVSGGIFSWNFHENRFSKTETSICHGNHRNICYYIHEATKRGTISGRSCSGFEHCGGHALIAWRQRLTSDIVSGHLQNSSLCELLRTILYVKYFKAVENSIFSGVFFLVRVLQNSRRIYELFCQASSVLFLFKENNQR